MLWLALFVLALLCCAIGYVFTQLGDVKNADDELTQSINDCLPQTQCAQCNYPGCRPYAEAIAKGEADINQCPPGGDITIQALAELLGVDPMPLNTAYGQTKQQQVALIDESVCIGCTLCIPPCPVDAIVGSAKLMHSVIASDCTGCELCLAPCPVDCITLVPAQHDVSAWRYPAPANANLQVRRVDERMTMPSVEYTDGHERQ